MKKMVLIFVFLLVSPLCVGEEVLNHSLTKEVEGIDFDLDLMYGNEDGLINQIAAFSLTKSFGEV